jgi:hypothetical protein
MNAAVNLSHDVGVVPACANVGEECCSTPTKTVRAVRAKAARTAEGANRSLDQPAGRVPVPRHDGGTPISKGRCLKIVDTLRYHAPGSTLVLTQYEPLPSDHQRYLPSRESAGYISPWEVLTGGPAPTASPHLPLGSGLEITMS